VPSLADGRDLLNEILQGKKWSPALTLFELIQMIPNFIVFSKRKSKKDEIYGRNSEKRRKK